MIMNNIFKELFGPIQAEEELKERTKAFLAKKTQGYTGAGEKIHRYPMYAAACACMLFILLGGCWLFFTPTAKISIDINPSIELSINRLDRVIFVDEFNEDGRELSNALDVKYKNYAEAIEQILNCDSITALLSRDEVMTITVIGLAGQQSARILSDVALCTANQSNTYCYFARSEEVAAAHEVGLSCGKYRAFLELQLLNPDITPEAVQGMTMREIRELIDSFTMDCENESASYNNRGNGHHGHGEGHGSGWRNGRTEAAIHIHWQEKSRTAQPFNYAALRLQNRFPVTALSLKSLSTSGSSGCQRSRRARLLPE